MKSRISTSTFTTTIISALTLSALLSACGDPSTYLSKTFPPNNIIEDPSNPVQSRDYEQAVGGYASQGSILRGDQLDAETQALVKIFRPRNRGYGSLDLVSLLESTARDLQTEYPTSERLQVGDTSSEHGGPQGKHSSHQNGLDADLVYYRVDRREMKADDASSSKTGFDEKFVIANRLTSNFDVERNWKMFNLLHQTSRVQRVFTDPVIKAEMCNYAKKQGVLDISTEVLRMLRPWPLHDDHMHVRLTCPKASPNCIAQAPAPAGSGCEEAFAEVAEVDAAIYPGAFAPLDEKQKKALERSLRSKVDEIGC